MHQDDSHHFLMRVSKDNIAQVRYVIDIEIQGLFGDWVGNWVVENIKLFSFELEIESGASVFFFLLGIMSDMLFKITSVSYRVLEEGNP